MGNPGNFWKPQATEKRFSIYVLRARDLSKSLER